MNSKLQTAETLFGFLRADPSFQIINEVESDGFGNACDVWKVKGLSVRFVCDRGQVSVEIGSTLTDKWYGLGLVQNMMAGGDVTEEPALDELASFFKSNQVKLMKLFSVDELINTKTKLAKLQQQRVRQMFPWKGN